MSTAVTKEETALSVREEYSSELGMTRAAASAQHEIQSAIAIAKRFPRSEDAAFGQLMRACKRPSFAEQAEYSFPRGDTRVTGPSVNLARAAAQCWGNLQTGLDIVGDTEETRHIRVFAWDMQSNLKVSAEDTFKKLVYRKKGGWVTPDERDLRELTNRRAAILERNCILKVVPNDLIEDAVAECRKTLRSGAAEDPEGQRKRLITGFDEIGVRATMLEEFLGHPLSTCSPDEIVQLRAIYKSIKDGQSTWSEYVSPKDDDPGGNGNAGAKPPSLKDKLKAEAATATVPPAETTPDAQEESKVPAVPGVAGNTPTARESQIADLASLMAEHGVTETVLGNYGLAKLSDASEAQLRAIAAECGDWGRE